MNNKKVTIYSDGSARGNPGRGGYGTVIIYTDNEGIDHIKEMAAGYKRTTNNRMEIMGVIIGLEALKEPCDINVYTDSKYVVNTFKQHWIDNWVKKGWVRGQNNEPVKNTDLWKRLLIAKEQHNVTFNWVKGHNGHTQNERCDELATSAADQDKSMLFDDEGCNI